MKLLLFVLFISGISIFQSVRAMPSGPIEIIYPPAASADDTRDNDIVELLELIMEATIYEFGPYTMKPLPYYMNEARFTELLKKEISLNVIWRSVTADIEEQLLSVKVPIRQGVLGYRIFLIKKQNQEKFSKIQHVEELKKMVVGQGQSWNDVKVFKHNEFKLATGASYEGLFEMLSKGRFDYFSRGINEAPVELKDRKKLYPSLSIEKSILLYYPWPKFFYVTKTNHALATRIKRGFEIIKGNDSYESWFWKYNGKAIFQANFKSRILFKIDNPLLPDVIPLDDQSLWFSPLE